MQRLIVLPRARWLAGEGAAPALARPLLVIALAFLVFGLFLTIIGRDPLDAYTKVFHGTLGSRSGSAK